MNLLNSSNDKTVHINVRFDENAIVFNRQINKVWLKEERISALPKACFQKTVHISILLENKRLRFAINGTHLNIFEHFAPLSELTELLLEGDLKVFWIKFDHNKLASILPTNILNHLDYHLNPTTPFLYSLNQPLQTQSKLFLSGIPLSNNQRFEINLDEFVGLSENENQKTAFHLSVRPDKKVLVRNSFDKQWENEEYECYQYPFVTNRSFNLCLLVTNSHFQCEIDGNPCFNFKHRNERLEDIRQIRILGAVRLNAFWYNS